MDSELTHVEADQISNEEEISLLDMASLVLRRRRLILISTFIGVLIGLGVALAAPLEYTATVSFQPHGGDQGGLSGVASVAQQFGFSVPRSGGGTGRTPEFYQDLLRSREILDGVVEAGVDLVTPNGVTKVDLAEHFEIVTESSEERNTRTRLRLANDVISVAVSPLTAVVTVSVRTDDPELSAAIGRRLLDLISEFDSQTRQSQATAERGFAEERLGQMEAELSIAEDSLEVFLIENRQFANSPTLFFEHDRLQRQVVMRQQLVTAMAQAYEEARIDEVRNLPIITVIDQPEPPALPDPRGRRLKLLAGLTLGMTLGLGLAFIREIGEQTKNDKSNAYREFQEVLKDARRDLFGLRKYGRSTPSSVDADQ